MHEKASSYLNGESREQRKKEPEGKYEPAHKPADKEEKEPSEQNKDSTIILIILLILLSQGETDDKLLLALLYLLF